jgi:hypothetical protein
MEWLMIDPILSRGRCKKCKRTVTVNAVPLPGFDVNIYGELVNVRCEDK